MNGNKKRIHIPKAPKVEEPKKIRRQDVKIRKNWTRSPAEQVHRDRRREEKYRPLDKGQLRKQINEGLESESHEEEV